MNSSFLPESGVYRGSNEPLNANELRRLDRELEEAYLHVKQLEEKEQFVETRLTRYRQILAKVHEEERKMPIETPASETSVETDHLNHHQQHEQKIQHLEEALAQIAETHKTLKSDIEVMKRRIAKLEEHRKKIGT